MTDKKNHSTELRSAETEAVARAFDWLDLAVKPPLKEVGLLIADKVRYWRYKNQLNIVLKARAMHEEKGISPRHIPIKVLASLLDYSSLEEDPDLQNMWANLLANSLDPSFEASYHAIFVSLLNELTPQDVRILDSLVALSTDDKYGLIAEQSYFECEEIEENLGEYLDLVGVSLCNLERLKLINQLPAPPDLGYLPVLMISGPSEEQTAYDNFKPKWTLSHLSIDFVKACSWIKEEKENE